MKKFLIDILNIELRNFLGVIFIALIPISTPLIVLPINAIVFWVGVALLLSGLLGTTIIAWFSRKSPFALLSLLYGIIAAVISLVYIYAYANLKAEMNLSIALSLILTIIALRLIFGFSKVPKNKELSKLSSKLVKKKHSLSFEAWLMLVGDSKLIKWVFIFATLFTALVIGFNSQVLIANYSTILSDMFIAAATLLGLLVAVMVLIIQSTYSLIKLRGHKKLKAQYKASIKYVNWIISSTAISLLIMLAISIYGFSDYSTTTSSILISPEILPLTILILFFTIAIAGISAIILYLSVYLKEIGDGL